MTTSMQAIRAMAREGHFLRSESGWERVPTIRALPAEPRRYLYRAVTPSGGLERVPTIPAFPVEELKSYRALPPFSFRQRTVQRPEPKPKSATEKALPVIIHGLALPLGEWAVGRAEGPLRFHLQSLDDMLAKVHTGRLAVFMTQQHIQEEQIATTRDGTLRLLKKADGLHFLLRPKDNEPGRLAARRLLIGKYIGVSAGYRPLAEEVKPDWLGGQTIVNQATVFELSLTDFPTFRQTSARLHFLKPAHEVIPKILEI